MSISRTVSLCFVPRGSHADPPRESSVLPPLEQDESGRKLEDAPPSRPSTSQHRYVAALRLDPPAWVPVSSLDDSSPSESTFWGQPETFRVRVSPGASGRC